MDRRKASAQVQRLEVVELGRRRRWSAAAKLRIVEESFAGWRQASATARRHGISPSLLFAWRKVYRAGALVDAEPGGLVPAVVVDERPAPAPVPSRIEIVTPNGYRNLEDRPDGLTATIARSSGLRELVAQVLPDNTEMLKVFEKSGFGLSTKRESGVVHVALRLT
jgi:transposase